MLIRQQCILPSIEIQDDRKEWENREYFSTDPNVYHYCDGKNHRSMIILTYQVAMAHLLPER